jgi:uncharacterized membrane protein YcaP (DUF421 family)
MIPLASRRRCAMLGLADASSVGAEGMSRRPAPRDGTMNDLFLTVFGPEGRPVELTIGQMIARAVVVYGAGLAMLRLGGHRLLGRYAAIDILMGILLGSILSRAVNGNAPLATSLVAGASLTAVHRLLSAAARRSERLSDVVKGRPHALIVEGGLREEAMRRHHVSPQDFHEALRLAGHDPERCEVRSAYIECNGTISFVPWSPVGVRKDAEAPRGGP